jgi:hypothetical protein
MAGLPHFTNSRAAINNFEPVYLNQFEVIINPPPGIPDSSTTFKGETILTQQGFLIQVLPSKERLFSPSRLNLLQV